MKTRIIQTILPLLLVVSALQAQESELQKQYRNQVLEYNQDVKTARYNLKMYGELEKSAKADFKPKLSAGGNFSYTGNPAELTLNMPTFGDPLTFQGENMKYGASLSLTQPLYTGGAIRESYKMAQKESNLAAGQSDMIKSQVSYVADVRYWNTVARKEIASVAGSYRQAVGRLADVVRNRVEVEYTGRNDLLMAEVKLNEADYQLMQANNDFEVARMSLNSFAGQSFDKAMPLDTAVIEITAIADLTHEMDIATGNRPEMRIARDKVDIQQSALKLADSRFKPQLYVGVDGSYSSPGYNFNSDLDPNYAVYAKLSIPLFEWGKRRNTKQASKYRIQMAEQNLSKVNEDIHLEIQTAYYSYSQAVAKVRLTANSLQKASENEALALDRYKEGNISVVEILEAQMYHQQAQLNYIRSKADAQIYRSGFIHALGLYSFE